MTGWGTRPITAFAVAVLAAGALAACGGSDSSTSSPSDTSGAPSSPQASQGAGKDAGQGSSAKGSEDGSEDSRSGQDEGGDGSGGDSDGSPPGVDPAPLKVSGGGSAQYRVSGGDNSVQEFGEEGDDSELEQAAAALHASLIARAEENWAAACSYMARTVKDQLDALASRSGDLKGKGCAEVLAALTPPLPAAARNESTIVDAGSLRFEGERAFLIYTGAKGATFAILMEKEDGSWKVGALSSIPLS